jgi:hypothetical protein
MIKHRYGSLFSEQACMDEECSMLLRIAIDLKKPALFL